MRGAPPHGRRAAIRSWSSARHPPARSSRSSPSRPPTRPRSSTPILPSPRRRRRPWPIGSNDALSAGDVSALTLSGSSPSAATHGIYSDLISLAKARRIPAFLDTYGPALEGIWGFWPSVIQLNRKEAAGQLRKQAATDGDVLGLLENWHRHGVTCGIVTDGPNPAIIQARQKRFRATPPPIKAVNPIGSGDSLLAGLVDAWLAGSDTEPMIRHAMGCAAANAAVWDAGAVDPEQAKRFGEEVILEPIGQGG